LHVCDGTLRREHTFLRREVTAEEEEGKALPIHFSIFY